MLWDRETSAPPHKGRGPIRRCGRLRFSPLPKRPKGDMEVQNCPLLGLVHLAGHHTLKAVQKKALDICKEIVGGKQEPHPIDGIERRESRAVH